MVFPYLCISKENGTLVYGLCIKYRIKPLDSPSIARRVRIYKKNDDDTRKLITKYFSCNVFPVRIRWNKILHFANLWSDPKN